MRKRSSFAHNATLNVPNIHDKMIKIMLRAYGRNVATIPPIIRTTLKTIIKGMLIVNPFPPKDHAFE